MLTATAFYTKQAVAALLSVHEVTVDRMVRDGRLPVPIKLGSSQNSRVRFPAAATDRAIERLARGRTAP